MEFITKTLLLGVFSTAAIDLWATVSNKLLKFPRTNWAMVGRWLGHMPSGKLIHNSISSSSEVQFENIIGWAFHYFIGVVYAFLYFAFITLVLNEQPTVLSAWLFGLITILSPWFVMQPSLGMGLCASKAPKPNMVRLQNFLLHSIFGIALFYGWLWSSYV